MHKQNRMSRIWCMVVLFGIVNAPLQTLALHSSYMETVKQWNLLNYNFPWDYPVANKDFYNAENIVATGIEVGYDRIYLATPRLFSGVPATLSSISRDSYGDSPALEAYPSWNHHRAGTKEYNCSDIGLVSVYRVRIDSCNRLWALDAGVSRSLEDFEITCPPKILIYDLYTNQVVRRIDFPTEVIRGESLFTNIIVDETTSRKENHCDDVFVYITDTVAPGIVVYDSEKDLTWRLSHPAMYPDPDFAESRILEHSFTLMDGVVGLAFDPEAAILYFQPLATDRLFSVSTAALRFGPLEFGKDLPVKLVGRKSSQGIGLAASPRGGTIFYSPLSETAVASWNPRTNEHSLLAQDKERIQFAADLRTPDRDETALYILTSKFHRFYLKNLNADEVNTRILRIDGVVKRNVPLQQNTLFSNQHRFAPTRPSYEHVSSNSFYNFPASSSSQFDKSLPVRTAPPSNGVKSYSSFVQNFYGKPPHPYNYEPVAIIDKTKPINPFFVLNSGEKTFPPPHVPRPQFGLNGEIFIQKVNSQFNDFNGLRFPKSLNFNETTLPH
ncbi:major royal jelly protein 1-like [Anopheles maculipalpis]|uniref:major royal jelly protein 1-like n=1 Tax=Anopheles maculipalpis TaxID=1496333 RepID=UPI002158A209|nr:major royal jelly protein 1-like [Anopheles maculipalpis]